MVSKRAAIGIGIWLFVILSGRSTGATDFVDTMYFNDTISAGNNKLVSFNGDNWLSPTTGGGTTLEVIHFSPGSWQVTWTSSLDAYYAYSWPYHYNGIGYHNNQWATGSNGWAVLQSDGNFVLYSDDDRGLWATVTDGSGDHVSLTNDGNLVVYDQYGQPVWSIYP
jgi:hypothetical protein